MAKTIQIKTLNVTVAIVGEPVPISETPIYTTDFNFHAKVTNSGSYMYIGEESTDNAKISYGTGSIANFTVGTGRPLHDENFDLSRIYIDADTAGDIAVIQYRVLES